MWFPIDYRHNCIALWNAGWRICSHTNILPSLKRLFIIRSGFVLITHLLMRHQPTIPKTKCRPHVIPKTGFLAGDLRARTRIRRLKFTHTHSHQTSGSQTGFATMTLFGESCKAVYVRCWVLCNWPYDRALPCFFITYECNEKRNTPKMTFVAAHCFKVLIFKIYNLWKHRATITPCQQHYCGHHMKFHPNIQINTSGRLGVV